MVKKRSIEQGDWTRHLKRKIDEIRKMEVND